MSFLTLRTLLFAAECVAASVLLPLLAFAVVRALRSAAQRHLAFVTVFGVLAVLPLAALLLPPRLLLLPVPAPMMEQAMAAPAPVDVAVTYVPDASESWATPENALLLLVLLWGAGLLWNLGRMALGAIGLWRLRLASETFAHPGADCAVRLSDGAGPSTFGLLRPVILLPATARDWDAGRMAAVLAHENAHVQRRDNAAQTLARLVCAVFWFNPLLWLAARALRRDAEIAADDAVLAGGFTPSSYAQTLLTLAAEVRGPALGVAMAGSALAARVQSILADTTTRKGVTRMDFARTLCLGLAATLMLGTARFDIALAQGAPVPPPADVTVRQPVTVERQVPVNVQKHIEAKAAAVKAEADLNVAHARARAAAQTDPAERTLFAQIAEQKAAEAAVIKADADLGVARARDAAQRAAQESDAAVLAAARAQRITVSPAEVDARMRQMGTANRLLTEQELFLERRRAIVDAAREKLAQAGQAPAAMVSCGPRWSNYPCVVDEAARNVRRAEEEDLVWGRVLSQMVAGNLSVEMRVRNISDEVLKSSEVQSAMDALRTSLADASRKVHDALTKAQAASAPAKTP